MTPPEGGAVQTPPLLPPVFAPGCRILFVGINPGIHSARRGHHFAGPGNRFWRLLHESGLTPRLLHWSEDGLLPQYGLGVTNLASRPTASSSELRADDFTRGRDHLRSEIASCRPRLIAMVGVTVYRQSFEVAGAVACGSAAERIDGVPVFVLPNPSGRNAHFSWEEMLASFRELTALVRQMR